ncbi:hypothetical protein D3C78_634630 [compost metagenome]
MLEMLKLGQGDDDCQAVDETEHHRIRHHAHQLAQAQQAEGNHDQPAEQYRGQQVLHTVLHHQGDDDHGHRPGRAGNHPGAATEQGGEGADDEGAVKPHQWIQMRHQREGDALGHQGKGRGESGQNVGADRSCSHGGEGCRRKRLGCYGSSWQRTSVQMEVNP